MMMNCDQDADISHGDEPEDETDKVPRVKSKIEMTSPKPTKTANGPIDPTEAISEYSQLPNAWQDYSTAQMNNNDNSIT